MKIAAAHHQPQAPRPAGNVLAFIPCTGGSGATFLATRISMQLAQNNSVLLVDLNLQLGDALSFVHEGKPASTLGDVAHRIGRLDAALLAASTVKVGPNFSILAAPEDHAQAIDVKPEHIDAILALAVSHYDFVLLDVGRPIDAHGIKALERADIAYIVMQASQQSIRNAKKMLAIFTSLSYAPGKIELIVNRYQEGGISVDTIGKTLGGFRLHTVPEARAKAGAGPDPGCGAKPGN